MVLGFGSIILLMVLIIVIAHKQMNLTFERIQQVVQKNNIKTSLISTMLKSARERTISIQKIVSLDDIFEQDEEFMQFNIYGANFIRARTKLKELGLNEEEKELLKIQGQITIKEVVPLQRKIVELAMSEHIDEARDLLNNNVLITQNKVFEKLHELLNNVENSSIQAAEDVAAKLKESKLKLILIMIMIILASLYISMYVIRRTESTEKQLSREKIKAQVTLHSIGDGVITTDNKGIVEYMNAVAETLTGFSSAQASNKLLQNIFKISSDLQSKSLINPVLNILNKQKVYSSDSHVILKNADQKEFAIEFTASPINDINNKITGIVLVFRDVTSMRKMSNQLGYQATHDELTELINRREFENRIKIALESAHVDDVEHSMCYLDLDQFKIVNDTCGHVAGDELLRQLSKLLKQEIRKGDTIARLGGDEFGILYLNCALEKAEELAEKLRCIVNDFQFNWDNKSFTVGVSIGIVQINKHGNMNAILSSADSACYVAKDKGRNRIHCYKENDNELIEREGQMQWIHRINDALEQNKFILYCQPIFDISLSRCHHYEILVRYIDEKNNIIPPMAFIPAAERYNLMNLIDSWIFENALLQINGILKKYSDIDIPSFAINLSAQSLCDDNFLDFVQEQFKTNNIDPNYICFEITETSAIVNLTRAQHFINTLKKIGVKFSLDDFGSGLSSFAYLKNLPVDYLKIDGTFVRDIIEDPIDMALVESINQVGHIMGIKTIAEYVENREIFEKLKEVGVDLAQGYYISRPIPLDEINLEEPNYIQAM